MAVSNDVLVAGAGPVGLFAALSLARRGVAVRIVDTGLWPCAHSYALGLHRDSLELLAELGLLDEVAGGTYPINTIGLYDSAERRASITLKNSDGLPGLAVLPQDALEGALEHALGKTGVKVEWRHEAADLEDKGTHVEATIDRYDKEARGYVVARTEWVVADSKTIQVPYVIGADGYNSRVRRLAGIDFPEVGEARYFAVFEFASDYAAGNEMRLVLADDSTNVLWPLPAGFCRWSFELPDYRDPDVERLHEYLQAYGLPTRRTKDRMAVSSQVPSLDEAALPQLIAERAPWFRGSIGEISWRTIVRFERRLASDFGRGRLWLTGDAAHLTGPVGMQSLNSGFAEAHELAVAIADRSEPKLRQYNDTWKQVWRQLHGLDGGLKISSRSDDWIRSRADRLLSSLPALGAGLDPLAGQIGLVSAAGA